MLRRRSRRAPVREPRVRAHADRWVLSLRREGLDRLLILGRRHLESIVYIYVRHYNEHRPHRSLGQPAAREATADWRIGGEPSTASARSPAPSRPARRAAPRIRTRVAGRATLAATEHALTSLLGRWASNAGCLRHSSRFRLCQASPTRGTRTCSPCQIRRDLVFARARETNLRGRAAPGTGNGFLGT